MLGVLLKVGLGAPCPCSRSSQPEAGGESWVSGASGGQQCESSQGFGTRQTGGGLSGLICQGRE